MNKLYIRARSIGRRLGLQRLYYRIFPHCAYEEKFHEALLAALKAGDVVWDVGANEGFYTKTFCEKTGAGGRVFAFEPAPDSHKELSLQTETYSWVCNELMALGDVDGTSLLVLGESHRRNHLERGAGEATGANSVQVQMRSGDSYWATSGVTPNVVKIDVEGFEEEVLAGMDSLLTAPELRVVFVEVHFRLLEERGRADAPVRIEKLLRGKGLHPKWVDESHIVAKRGKSPAAQNSAELHRADDHHPSHDWRPAPEMTISE
jgi:FkbM family methyltransferase